MKAYTKCSKIENTNYFVDIFCDSGNFNFQHVITTHIYSIELGKERNIFTSISAYMHHLAFMFIAASSTMACVFRAIVQVYLFWEQKL